MTQSASPGSPSDKPNDPAYEGGEDEHPPREPPDAGGQEVKEPSDSGPARKKEKFPRKGEV